MSEEIIQLPEPFEDSEVLEDPLPFPDSDRIAADRLRAELDGIK